ncbi:MAG: FAD-dependent oxidoreductase [Nitrososphaerota archaeon]
MGGGLAGGYAANAIRSMDETGLITIVSEEMHRPYDRVPLSKTYLRGALQREKLYIRSEEYYRKNRIEPLMGRVVVGLDTAGKTAILDSGERIRYDKLLLSTGGRPKRLNVEGSELGGIYYLRTIDDADRIRAAIESADRAVVVGGGFIGCETASTLKEKGLDITMVEATNNLLGRVLDQDTASWITSYFREMGVKLRTGTSVVRFLGEGGLVSAVEIAGGEILDADMVIVGIGISPRTELAEKAGLKVDNGIVVNEYLEASARDVYAAGDVARFYSPIYRRHIRVEHYDAAVTHGEVAGSNMAGSRRSYSQPPYFFSNMPSLRMQVYGVIDSYDNVVAVSEASHQFAKFYLHVNRDVDVESVIQLIASRRQIHDSSDLAKYLS